MCCRFVQTTVKTAIASDLSLRGRFAPVAISGRQLRFRQGLPVVQAYAARLPRRFAPRNDKSGGFAPLNFCRDHCQSARRSLSAATDAIGVCYFNDSRYKSAVGAPPISHKNIPDAAASGISLSKKSFQTFSPNCFQNCKINFCSTILQFCRCGGLFNAKGNPDGFLSHFSSLRSFWLGSFLTV